MIADVTVMTVTVAVDVIKRGDNARATGRIINDTVRGADHVMLLSKVKKMKKGRLKISKRAGDNPPAQ